MGFPGQEYQNGLSFSSPGDLPDAGTESPSPALAGGFFTTEPGKPNGPQTRRFISGFSEFCSIKFVPVFMPISH